MPDYLSAGTQLLSQPDMLDDLNAGSWDTVLPVPVAMPDPGEARHAPAAGNAAEGPAAAEPVVEEPGNLEGLEGPGEYAGGVAGESAGEEPAVEGTLLAVVPIPGTATSLAIVGYPVRTSPAGQGPSGGAARAGYRPAAEGLALGVNQAAARDAAAAGVPAGHGAAPAAGDLASAGIAAGIASAGWAGMQVKLRGAVGGGLFLDHTQRRVWTKGGEIELTFQEFELLSFLTDHPATVFTRAELVEQVWQREFHSDSRTVDVHVSRLRQKLGPALGRCLVTEYRVGYQFRPPSS